MKITSLLGLGLILSLASACSYLPRNGPDDGVIRANAFANRAVTEETLGYDYVVVDVTRNIIPFISEDDTNSFSTFGANRNQVPLIRLGAGDVVQVTIFESQSGGLFIPEEAGVRPGNFVTLPSQEIGRDGEISVPYAGSVRASGRTPGDVEDLIEERLAAQAIEPQVTLEVIEANFARASVIGSVNEPGIFTLRNSGDRVLDLIAQAGGISTATHESFVTLSRGGSSAKIAYESLTASPRENIFVAPGDTVDVSTERKEFFAFGATGSVGEFTFDSSNINLNSAVAQATGLNDTQADPADVFIYRIEHRHALEAMGVNVSGFYGHDIPTIYRADFRKPDSFFMARDFSIRDGDIVYVSNAESVSISKFFGLITNVTGSSATINTDMDTLRN